MSDLLSLLVPPGSKSRVSVRRPLVVSAMVAALGAMAALMLPLMALALVGWMSIGAEGSSNGALRVGADAWLLAHGSGMVVSGSAITFIPLGLTGFSLLVSYRTGRWAAETSAIEDVLTLGIGALSFAITLGVSATVTAVLCSTPTVQPGVVRAFGGAFLVGLLAGGSGLLAGSEYRLPLPEPLRASLAGAAATALALLAAGAFLVTASFLAHFGAAASMLSGLHVHGLGGILVLAATFAVAPNLSLLGTAYLMGPGFAIGTGTIVSPTDVVLGPVPAVPFVSAIPEGTPPWWASLLVVLPVVLAVLVAVRTTNAYPVRSFPESILRGLLTGGFAVFVTTVSVFLAGGAIGPGRMQHTGASGSAMLVASTILLMSGALVGSLVAGWRQIRGRSSGADQ